MTNRITVSSNVTKSCGRQLSNAAPSLRRVTKRIATEAHELILQNRVVVMVFIAASTCTKGHGVRGHLGVSEFVDTSSVHELRNLETKFIIIA